MTSEIVTLMLASSVTSPLAHSALPNAPVIAEPVRVPRWAPRVASVRRQLAGVVWPGELRAIGMDQPVPTTCG